MRLDEGILVAVELWGFDLVALVVEEVLDRLDGFLILLVADEVDSGFAILLRLAKRGQWGSGLLLVGPQSLDGQVFDLPNLAREQFGRGHAFAAVLD